MLLAISGQCRIEQDSSFAVGTPHLKDDYRLPIVVLLMRTVIMMFMWSASIRENNHKFGLVNNDGTINVQLSVRGQSSKPLVPLKPPNLIYFWNYYDYVSKDNAIYGVCTGNDAWNWCRIKPDKLHKRKIKVEFVFWFLKMSTCWAQLMTYIT